MKVRYFTNLVLILLVIGLYWFINLPEDNNAPQQETLTTLKANQVTDIIVHRSGRDTIKLVKDNTHWTIRQPIQAKANKTRVNLILDLLTLTPSKQFQITTDMSLKQFGLDPATISLQLNQQQFQFGNIEILSKKRYIKHHDAIYLVSDRLEPLLNSTAASFIDNHLIDDEDHISQLQLPDLEDKSTSKDVPITIKMVNGHWQSNKKSISTDKLTTIVDAWRYAYALQVIPLSTDTLHSLTGEKILVSFQGQLIPTEFLLQLSKQSLSLINLKNKIKYQFPLTIKQQLFPIKTQS